MNAPHKRNSQAQVALPYLTEKGCKVARDIINASFQLDSGEKKPIRSITLDDLRRESERIAGIEQTALQVNQILAILAPCISLAQDCQNVATLYLEVAGDLEEAAKRMNLLGVPLRIKDVGLN